MLRGVLVAESLRSGAVLDGVALRVTRVVRREAGDAGAGQPVVWTLLDFEVDDDGLAPALAEEFGRLLAPVGGWYVNFNAPSTAYVVFAGRVFAYPRGDRAARAEVVAYGRGVGVPTGQLDWED